VPVGAVEGMPEPIPVTVGEAGEGIWARKAALSAQSPAA